MTISEFIAHLTTTCHLNGLNPDETDITFNYEGLIVIPDDIELFRNELVISFK